MYWDEALTDFYEGDLLVYNPCAFTLDAATVPAGSPERGRDAHHARFRDPSTHLGCAAAGRAWPGTACCCKACFAAAHGNTGFFHLTYFGILSMPGAPVLDYCVDIRASVWVRIEGQHNYLNMELMQRHADGVLLMLESDTRSTPTRALLFSVWTWVDARHQIGVCA